MEAVRGKKPATQKKMEWVKRGGKRGNDPFFGERKSDRREGEKATIWGGGEWCIGKKVLSDSV